MLSVVKQVLARHPNWVTNQRPFYTINMIAKIIAHIMTSDRYNCLRTLYVLYFWNRNDETIYSAIRIDLQRSLKVKCIVILHQIAYFLSETGTIWTYFQRKIAEMTLKVDQGHRQWAMAQFNRPHWPSMSLYRFWDSQRRIMACP